ncbi:MAG: hypothetical protein NC293_07005 [Roseburia sp.]|nr:hypothetical protein [Roseburia sp.]
MNNKKMDIINDMEFTSLTVITSFLLGQYIVEQEQQGQERAKYGSKVIDSLSSYLTKE